MPDQDFSCGAATASTEVAVGDTRPEPTWTALDEAHRRIEHARFNLSHADTKASLLAAGAIPIAALILAAPSLTRPSGFATAMSWCAAGLMLLGIAFLGCVVWPRLRGRSGIRAAANRSAEQVARELLAMSSDRERLLRNAAEELILFSTLALVKFRWLRAAIVCFAFAAVFMIVAAIGFAGSG
jgi:hypothetical protein